MIALIDYDAGNTRSVMNALKRLNVDYNLTDNHDEIRSADKVIFPGVGHAAAAMQALKRKGLVSVIQQLKQPVLGICVGLQLLTNRSEEGATECLGILDAEVIKFNSDRDNKVPHMGWNEVRINSDDPFWGNVADDSYFYFVHSYYVPVVKETIGISDYMQPFSAVIRKDNFWATQFHVEKSGNVGSQLLSNFVNGDLK